MRTLILWSRREFPMFAMAHRDRLLLSFTKNKKVHTLMKRCEL